MHPTPDKLTHGVPGSLVGSAATRGRYDSKGPMSTHEQRYIARILSNETMGGALIAVAAFAAVVLANTPLASTYESVRDTPLGAGPLTMSLGHWASDGLLAVFFFLAGLELKRELIAGDLRSPAKALVPVVAAAGGVVLPAVLFVAINLGSPENLRGWAIPTATDIAFALAVLALVGRRLPAALRTFLLTLAIVDDLVAIVIIAVFYTTQLNLGALGLALLPLGAYLFIARKGRLLLKRRRRAAWLLLLPFGVATWFFIYQSGIHATVAGVLLAFTVPVTDDLAETLEHRFRPLSAGFCVPVFAFFSAGVSVAAVGEVPSSTVGMGIAVALVLGKTVGIAGATWLVTRLPGVRLGEGINWLDMWGVAALGGMGFTVSLLLAELSFPDGAEVAKAAVLVASVCAAFIGGGILAVSSNRRKCEVE